MSQQKKGEKMTSQEAINIILSDTKSHNTSLNYAVSYCLGALHIPKDSYEYAVQLLYILANISHWRHPKAKEVRQILKNESSALLKAQR